MKEERGGQAQGIAPTRILSNSVTGLRKWCSDFTNPPSDNPYPFSEIRKEQPLPLMNPFASGISPKRGKIPCSTIGLNPVVLAVNGCSLLLDREYKRKNRKWSQSLLLMDVHSYSKWLWNEWEITRSQSLLLMDVHSYRRNIEDECEHKRSQSLLLMDVHSYCTSNRAYSKAYWVAVLAVNGCSLLQKEAMLKTTKIESRSPCC